MSGAAITVEGLGKMYRLGGAPVRDATFRDVLTGLALAPIRRLQGKGAQDGDREEFWALRDVSFEVQPGEVVGIIGRNGAGKSTLLKVLSRIVEPTLGQVTLRGRVASLLEVGTGFHPELTGRENIYLNGSILGMKRREINARFDEIVSFAEVEKFLDTPVKRYSSGMYVRLAFAVAAHLNPEILIVDEVLAVGDAEFQKKCLGKMREVAQGGSGRTVVFVSHNMTAVKALCQKGVFLRGGRIVTTGPVDEVVQQYLFASSTEQLGLLEPKRPEGAAVWIQRAEVFSEAALGRSIRMGDELTLRVHFGANPPISRPRLGWVLSDAFGTRLLCANNRYQQSVALDRAVPTGVMVCRLGMVPLMPGRYFVSLWLGNDVMDTHILSDALGFEIAAHDLWGDAKVPPAGASAMWWPASFVTEHQAVGPFLVDTSPID